MRKVYKKICYLVSILLIVNFAFFDNAALASTNRDNNDTVNLIITFKDKIDEDTEELIVNSNGEIVNEFPDIGGIEVKCSADLIPEIKNNKTVQSLTPNHLIKISNEETEEVDSSDRTDDLYEKYQWDIKRVTNNGESYNIESGNHDIVVGIVDSGVDVNHPDLACNFLGGKNCIPADFSGDESESGDISDVNDRLGHGTNVAGMIAANGRIKGVAPNIGFKSYRVFNEEGQTTAPICAQAIIEAVKDNVNVINLSVGGYDLKGKCYWTDPKTNIKYNLGDDMADYTLYKRAIKYAIKNNVTVVSASGNESLDCSDRKGMTKYLNETASHGFSYDGLTYECPSDVKNVITVSATDKNDKLASYSNYGSKYVDITAPGGDMTEPFTLTDMCITTNIDSSYMFTCGTSISAPKVSAIAALLLCENRDLTPKQVAKKIYKTSDKLKDNKSSFYGAGMANAYKALK